MNKDLRYTKEQAKDIFVKYTILAIDECLDMQGNDDYKLGVLVHTIFFAIDVGSLGMPPYRLEIAGKDIAGGLHEKFFHAPLDNSTEDRFIADLRNLAEFHIDRLPKHPDRTDTSNALHCLAHNFLQIIDGTFNNRQGLSLIPHQSEDHKQICINRGQHYYPDNINISGDLAKRFCVNAKFVPTNITDISSLEFRPRADGLGLSE